MRGKFKKFLALFFTIPMLISNFTSIPVHANEYDDITIYEDDVGDYEDLSTNYSDERLSSYAVSRVGSFDMTVTPHVDGYGSVALDWANYPYQDKNFKVYKSEDGGFSYETVGIDYTLVTNVRCLHIYPDTDYENQYKDWIVNSGYGKGIISVDSVYWNDFCNNTDYYLKDSNGNYKYDVLLFGTCDGNAMKDLTADSRNKVEQYLQSGRGCIMGHDAILSELGGQCKPYLQTLSPYFGITFHDESYFPEGTNISSVIRITKKGLFTTYPWYIGEVGTLLSIPEAHTNGQVASSAKIWLEFVNSEHPSYTPNSNFYLATYNNCAIIQTGHSGGNSSVDEQKILANLIFYCNQLIFNTYHTRDSSAQDFASPNQPSISDSVNTFNFECTDNGSTYYYYVEAFDKNDTTSTGLLDRSVTKSITVTTGVRSYRYILDNSINTTVTTANSTLTYSSNITANRNYDYIHVAAIDGAGNMGPTQTMKINKFANYTVNHYQQNVDGTTYSLAETETFTDTIGQTVTPTVKTYEIFNSPSTQSGVVAEGNTLVINYYYTRKSAAYKVNHYQMNTDGTTYTLAETDNLSGLIGATVSPTPRTYAIFYTPETQSGIINKDNTLTINYYYIRKKTHYTVKHYLMNTDGVNYTLVDSDRYEALIGSTVTPPTKSYTGFTTPASQSGVVEADGSLEIKYYYTRHKSTLRIEPNNGYWMLYNTDKEYTQYYETTLDVPKPTRYGYTFVQWDRTNNYGTISSLTDNAVYAFGPTNNVTDKITARWRANRSTLKINPNEGIWNGSTETQSFKQDYNTTKDVPAPTRHGYTFTGWEFINETDPDNGINGSWLTSDNKVVYTYGPIDETVDMFKAKWRLNESTLTVDPNGGLWVDSGKTYRQPSNFTDKYMATKVLQEPTKEGYTFTKWTFTNSQGNEPNGSLAYSGQNATYTYGSTANARDIVIAEWQGNKSILRVNPNCGEWEDNGTIITTTKDFEQEYKTKKTINIPTRDGYVFLGWEITGDDVSNPYKINGQISSLTEKATYTYGINANRIDTLTAQWKANESNLEVNPNGGAWDGGNGLMKRVQTYTQETGTTKDISIPIRDGYTFAGWDFTSTTNRGNGTNNGNGTMSSLVDNATYTFGGMSRVTDTITAKWTGNSSTLRVNPSGGSWTHDGVTYTDTQLFENTYNNVIDISIPKKAGYTFTGWTFTSSISNGAGTNSGNGTISNLKGDATYTYGSEPNAVDTITANWRLNKSKLVVIPGGVWKGMTGHQTFMGSYGDTVDIPIPVKEGYTFKKWEVTENPLRELYGEMTSMIQPATYYFGEEDNVTDTITAMYEVNKSTLIVNPNGGEWNESTRTETFTKDYAISIEIPNPTRDGYIFSGWKFTSTVEDGNGTLYDKNYVFGPINNATDTITAQWIKEDEPTGNIWVIKQLSGDVNDEIGNNDFTFIITGDNDYSNTVTIKGSGEKTINNVPVGTYTIKEINSDIDGYTVTTSGEGVIEVIEGKSTKTEIINNYEALKGNLTIAKSVLIKGEGNVESGLTDKQFTFIITNDNGYKKTLSIRGNGNAVITDLVAGEYVITEAKADVTGYVHTVTGTGNVVVTPNGNVRVSIVNTYEKLPEPKGSLTITKNVIGVNTSDRVFTFLLKGNDYNKEFTVKAGKSVTINDIPIGNYTIEEIDAEIDGYENSVSGTGKITIKEDETTNVTVTNEYEKIPDSTGKLTITKKVIGVDASKKDFSITVTGNGYNETINIRGNKSVTLNDLPIGTYTISEDGESAIIDGYSHSVSGTGKVIINENRTAKVEIVNSYIKIEDPVKTGNLTIRKSVIQSGEGTLPQDITEKEFKFHITGDDYDNEVTIKGSGYVTLHDLPVGRYSVSEENEDMDGYTNTVSGIGDVTVKQDNTSSITITNSYKKNVEPTGDLKIVKQATGLDVSGRTFRFKIKGEGYTNNVSIIGEGERVIYKLPIGEYTITEEKADIDGYTYEVTGTGKVIVEQGKTNTVTITNNYTKLPNPIGTINITKTAIGIDVSDKVFTFLVSGDNYSKTVSVTGANSVIISDVPAGNYTITEMNADISGYTYVVSGTGNITVRANETTNVVIKNTYTKIPETPSTGTLVIHKVAHGVDVSNKEFNFTISGSNYSKTVTIKGEGSKTIFDIPAGSYVVTETNAEMDGYTLKTMGTGNVNISKGMITSVVISNNYEKIPEVASTLTISKNVEGIDNVTNRMFNFTISGNGYNKEVSIHGGGSITFNIPEGTYLITETNAEINGYTLNTTGIGSVTITKGQDTKVVVTNSYEKIAEQPKVGTLSIRKEVNGINKNMKFVITVNGDNYSETFEIKNGEQKEISNLPAGEYVITEADAEIDGYIHSVSGTGRIIIQANKTSEVTVINSYEKIEESPIPTGNLTIIKKVTGDADVSNKIFTFEITGNNYTNNVMIMGEGSETVHDIPVGEYVVKEKDAMIDGYIHSTSGIGKVTINEGITAEITITNNYVEEEKPETDGYLTIQKEISGIDASEKTFTFIIKGGDYTQIVIIQGSGNRTIKLPQGEYIIEERNADIDGYTYEVTGIGQYTITAGETKSVVITNTYTKIEEPIKVGNLTINKKVSGNVDVSNKEFQFKISGNDYEEIIKVNGNESVTIELPIGTYNITEIDANIAGFTHTVTGTGNVTINENNTTNVDIVNTYKEIEIPVKTGSIEISKKTVGLDTEDKTFTFTIAGSDFNENISLKSNDSYTVSNIPVGEYTITETDTEIDGYTYSVSGVGKVTVTENITIKVNVVNTYTEIDKPIEKPDTGSLTLTKKVVGLKDGSDMQFNFVISGNGYEKTVSVKNGESQTIHDLPVGDYLITEMDANVDGYNHSVSGLGKITITKNSNNGVIIVNTYTEKEQSVKTGNLMISKKLSGDLKDNNKEFNFIITGNGINETITLKSGETKSLKDIPIGEYTISEDNADVEGYTLTTSGTGKITVSENDTKVVVIINNYKKNEEPKKPTIIPSTDPVTEIYDGDGHPIPEDKITVKDENGNPVTSDKIEITYKTPDGEKIDGEPKDAGEYQAEIKVTYGDVTETIVVTIKILPKKITITTGSGTKQYDGTPLTNNEYTISGDKFVDTNDIKVLITGTQTEIGKSQNTYKIDFGKDKASNYEITSNLGTLEVTKEEELNIATDSITGIYDGNTHIIKKDEIKITLDGKEIVPDDIEIEYFDANGNKIGGEPVDVGEYTAKIKVVYGDKEKNIETTIQITKRTIIITTNNDSKIYDGKALTNNGYYLSGDEFVAGDGKIIITGSQTNVGYSLNTYYIEWKAGKEKNYEIIDNLGTLTVKEKVVIKEEPPQKNDTSIKDEIPDKKSDDVKTGDDYVVIALIFMMALAISGIAYKVFKRKKV